MSRWVTVLFFTAALCRAQTPAERSFSAPVAKVGAAVKKLPGGTSGPLPILDGFVDSGGRALQEFERPYYQCTVRVTPTPSGGSLVHVTAKITAWNKDPAHPRYEVLRSNGRLESDVLDRLEQVLGESTTENALSGVEQSAAGKPSGNNPKATPVPEISAPVPQLPSASAIGKMPAQKAPQSSALEQQAKSLEDVLRNQGHPTDLVAVKETETPVLQDPASDAKVLFLASAEDEFEVLDINPDWVHVRISGLSRGWLRRTSVEILSGSELPAESTTTTAAREPMAATGSSTSTAKAASSSMFSVTDEEDGSFPGDWAPLKGKSVRIISVQPTPGTGKNTSPQDKMRFAESVFKTEPAKDSSAGLVLIFDAQDGGIIAATRSVLEMWKSGALSEQAFWKQCYLDPPEILGTL